MRKIYTEYYPNGEKNEQGYLKNQKQGNMLMGIHITMEKTN